MSKLADYLSLMRIGLLPTAWSNVLAGFALTMIPVAHNGHWWQLACLLIISSCMYTGGMVLNDVFDLEEDRKHRPQRPLPSERIPLWAARVMGFGLLIAGSVIALVVSLESDNQGFALNSPTAGIAVALACAILLYNSRVKESLLGPWVMGSCRCLNFLLGCSLVPMHSYFVVPAIALGIYIAGITLFARDEHKSSPRKTLIPAVILMGIATGILIWYSHSGWFAEIFLQQQGRETGRPILFTGLLAMMLFPVFRRAMVSIANPNPLQVKRTVISGLLAIILIDASLCYLVAPAIPAYALCVALLIIPAYWMTRHIAAT